MYQYKLTTLFHKDVRANSDSKNLLFILVNHLTKFLIFINNLCIYVSANKPYKQPIYVGVYSLKTKYQKMSISKPRSLFSSPTTPNKKITSPISPPLTIVIATTDAVPAAVAATGATAATATAATADCITTFYCIPPQKCRNKP